MINQEIINPYSGPSTYQITVHGYIDDLTLQNLGGLNVSYSQTSGKQLSTLTGNVADQSALSGILNTLIDHRYSVISVMKIE